MTDITTYKLNRRALEVLHIYKSSETQERLGSEFGIRQSMVSRIKNGVYWHWLTGGIAQ